MGSDTKKTVPVAAASASASAVTDAGKTKGDENPTRSVKQFLHQVVRDNWEFPSARARNNVNSKDNDDRKVVAWQFREEGLSDIDHERENQGRRRASRASVRPSSAQYHNANASQQKATGAGGVNQDNNSTPYKFDTPDAVGDFVRERRGKRRRLIAEECRWNEGLKHWIHQRDAWTKAVERKPAPGAAAATETATTTATDDSKSQQPKTKPKTWRHTIKESGGTLDSAPISSSSEVSPEPQPVDKSSCPTSVDDVSQNRNLPTNATTTSIKKGDNAKDNKYNYDDDEGEGEEEINPLGPYIPIYPPLFEPDHVLRSRIQPTAYPVIYSKVVIQSLTPNIPIPLNHMIQILVTGWKAEGNWPPEPAPQPPAGSSSAAAGVSSKSSRSTGFLRWKRERAAAREARQIAAAAAAAAAAATATATGSADGSTTVAIADDDGKDISIRSNSAGGGRRERVRKSIGFAVKRGLGLGLDSHHGHGHGNSNKIGKEKDKEKESTAAAAAAAAAAEDMDVGIEFREHSENNSSNDGVEAEDEAGAQGHNQAQAEEQKECERLTPEEEREASRIY